MVVPGAACLRSVSFPSVPRSASGIARYGLKIVRRVPLETKPRNTNRRYLQVKKDKLGHLLSKVQ